MNNKASDAINSTNPLKEEPRFSLDWTRIDTLPISQMIWIIKTDEIEWPTRAKVLDVLESK